MLFSYFQGSLCATCGQKFAQSSGLSTHMKFRHADVKIDLVSRGRRGAQRRKNKSFRYQLSVIDAVEQAYADNVPFPRSAVAEANGIAKSLVTAWLKPASQLKAILMVAAGKGQRRRVGGRGAKFPDCENQLYREFYDRRVYQGLRVSHRWLRRHMARIL
jgi:hypothetical protein